MLDWHTVWHCPTPWHSRKRRLRPWNDLQPRVHVRTESESWERSHVATSHLPYPFTTQMVSTLSPYSPTHVQIKGKGSVQLLMELSSQLWSVTCHLGSHSVTCHPTQVNTPRLNPSQTGQYSIYLPWRDGRLSWPRWPVTYRDGLPVPSRSPNQVLTGTSVD